MEEDVEVGFVFSQAVCERGFVPKWCEEEETDPLTFTKK